MTCDSEGAALEVQITGTPEARGEGSLTQCRLCKRLMDLQLSHIIPEFFYRPIYDEKHRLFPRVGGAVQGPPLQKGLREHLLCRDCEQMLSRHEKYVSEVLFGGTPIVVTQYNDRVEFEEINYRSVRLCFLSMLWRMGVASGKSWQNVTLGPHEERLRTMINAEKPGTPTAYSFICAVPLFEGEACTDLILGPDSIRHDRARLYRIVLGGMMVAFRVGSAPPGAEFRDLTVTPDGRWTVPVLDANKFPFLVQEAARMVRAEKERSSIQPICDET